MKINSDFYVLMLIKNYKQLENKQTNKMNEQIIRQTEDRHTDSLMIGIMTEREHWTKKRGREKGKKGERERGRGRNRLKNSKKDSLKRCSHKPKQYYSIQIFAFHAIPEISSLAGAFE